MSKLEHALNHAARGWPVFILAPGTKVPPKATHGLKDATTDEETIRAWFNDGVAYDEVPWINPRTSEPEMVTLTGNSDFNIGIATGPAGLVVIDTDLPKTGEQWALPLYGLTAWCQLVWDKSHNTEPKTYEVESPSGGVHLYWKAPSNLEIKTAASTLLPGVDVRAHNGSITAAGSCTNAGVYDLRREVEPLEMPVWLRLSLLNAGLAKATAQATLPFAGTPSTPKTERTGKGSPYARAAMDREIADLAAQTEGGRNHKLNAVAYRLGRFLPNGQLDEADVRAALLAAALQTGLGEKEALSTINGALNKAANVPVEAS